MRWKTVALAGALGPAALGCNIVKYATETTVNEHHVSSNQHCIEHDLRKQAHSLWKEVRAQYPRRAFTAEFRDGFCDGYVDYLDRGGNGSLPAVPPPKYTRHKKYFTENGQCLVKDYFLGFKYGQDIAIATGKRQFLTVPVLLPVENNNPPAFMVQPPATATLQAPTPAVPVPLSTPTPMPLPAPTPAPAPTPPEPTQPREQVATPPAPQPEPTPQVKEAAPVVEIPTAPAVEVPTLATVEPMVPAPVVTVPTVPTVPTAPIAPSAVPPVVVPRPVEVPALPAPVGKLPPPPTEVPELPAYVPTPPITDDLPIVRPNHADLPVVPPSHPEAAGK